MSFSKGKDFIRNGKYRDAISVFENMFLKRPKAWWLIMEAFRCVWKSTEVKESKSLNNSLVLYTPNYKGNTYQSNLYEKSDLFGFDVKNFDGFDNLAELFKLVRSYQFVFFHQHWLKEIYIKSHSLEFGIKRVDCYISKLKALKTFGVKIIWTVHNIMDHDINSDMAEVCKYAITQFLSISDVILIHCSSNKLELEKITDCKIANDLLFVLPHPLYDKMLGLDYHVPPELKNFSNKRFGKILIFVGMIRPYKGLDEFNIVLKRLESIIEYTGLKIIVAGEFCNDQLYENILTTKKQIPDALTIINRRVSDNELGYLLSISSLMVLPYRSILTSGSYFAASTFSLPVIAPNIGSFVELINHGETGFLYDGTINDFEAKLIEIVNMQDEKLKEIGANAYKARSECAIDKIRELYFNKISGLK